MKILVLGGAGYIGSHTVYELIDAGHEVVIVDNLVTGFKEAVHPEAKFYEGDIRDKAFLDHVFEQETIDANVEFFDGPITKGLVEKVVTLTTNIVPEEAKDTSWDVSQAQNGSIMAWYLDEDSNGYYELYIGQEGGVKANPDSSKLFNYFINVTEIDLSNLDTSNVTNMRAMFQDCQLLEKLNISNFNTTKVTIMRYMFNYCYSLTELDLSHFDTSKVTEMQSMFQFCSALKSLNISSFNTSKVENMEAMFNNCTVITELDLSHFDTSKVTNMTAMFQHCQKLTNLNISSFNTSKVTSMSAMFFNCHTLENLDLSSFNTSEVTTMQSMFCGMSSLKELDLSKFNTSKVTNMSYMFGTTTYETNCSSLTSLDLSNFDISNVTEMVGMFSGAANLTSITVKDNESKTFIEARLTDAKITATVTTS